MLPEFFTEDMAMATHRIFFETQEGEPNPHDARLGILHGDFFLR